MANTTTYLGLPVWVHDSFPENWGLFTQAAAKATELFEEDMREACDLAGGPDHVDSGYVSECARERFSTAYAALNGLGLSDDQWTELEDSFLHQMRNHFDTSLSISWRGAEEGIAPGM